MRHAIIFLIFLFVPLELWAVKSSDPSRELLEKMISHYQSLSGFEANFRQLQSMVGSDGKPSGPQEEASGMLRVQKPNQMLWEYEKPYKRIFLADGKNFEIIDYEDKQSMKGKQKPLEEFPALVRLLLGQKEIVDQYKVSWVGEEKQESEKLGHILFTPHSNPLDQDSSIHLWVSMQAPYVIRRSKILDSFGGQYTIEYQDQRVKSNMKKESFTHQTPKDFVIIPLDEQQGFGF
ncbi:MAG: outer membrane lipoprotein carrier protein LolA [Bdellovibrionales bacterium]|nr:outer membrane lipoprotein carrier protein LolA [Bdellovibrionales bacterium]